MGPVAILAQGLHFSAKPTHPHLTEVDGLLRDSSHAGSHQRAVESLPRLGAHRKGAPVCPAWVLRHVQAGITEADTSVDNAKTSGHTMTIQAAPLLAET